MISLILAIAAASAPAQPVDPKTDNGWIWQALSTEAFNEMRCHGLSAEQTRRRYDRQFKARQDRIREALVARAMVEDEDRILIGRQCPYYEGAHHRLKVALSVAERRLDLPPLK